MTSKKLLSVVLALVFALSLMTALPVSAADGSLVATVGGSIVGNNAVIPANSEIVFTVPYALTEDDVAENVVLAESDKASPANWNPREFSYDLDGDTLTVDFAAGILAMNGSYQFTFKDPAGAGVDVTFPFTSTAVEGYAMYENFERYPVGVIGTGTTSSTSWKPFQKYHIQDNNGVGKIEIASVEGDKVLRVHVDNMYQRETMVSYLTGFSASITKNSVKGTTEAVFTIAPKAGQEGKTIFEIAGIGILPKNDTTYEIYAKTVYREIATSNAQFIPADWTLLDTVTFASKEERDAKHKLSMVTITDATTNDARTLHELYFGTPENTQKIGATVIGEGIAMATGNHSARIQGILFSKKGASQNSMIIGLQNSGSGGGGSLDLYTLAYIPYVAPPATLTPSKASGSVISQTETLVFTSDVSLDPATVTGAITLKETAKAGTIATLDRVLPTPVLSENNTKITIAFPSGYLAPNTEYTVVVADTIQTAEKATLTNPGNFVYTTNADDGYYINESFERYATGTFLNGTTATTKPEKVLMMPWAKAYGNPSAWNWNQHLVDINGDKALRLAVDYTKGYGYLAFHNAYAAEAPANAAVVTGTFEIDFSIKGTPTSVFEVNDFIFAPGTEAGTYSVRIRQGGAMQGSLGDLMAELCTFTAPTSTAARYTLKYDIQTNAKLSTDRIITKASITPAGGVEQELPLPGGRVYISLNERVGTIDGAINYDGAATDYSRMFGIGETSELDPNNYPTLDVYSVKYAPSGVTIQAAKGADAGDVVVTITNKGETLNAVIAVAVYNGNELVGVAGLNEGVTSIANGAPVTITKNIANAQVGNTYKVIFLNNMTSVQPLFYTITGTIQ